MSRDRRTGSSAERRADAVRNHARQMTSAPFASTVPPAAPTAMLLEKATLEIAGDCIWRVPPPNVMVPPPTESAFVTCTVTGRNHRAAGIAIGARQHQRAVAELLHHHRATRAIGDVAVDDDGLAGVGAVDQAAAGPSLAELNRVAVDRVRLRVGVERSRSSATSDRGRC